MLTHTHTRCHPWPQETVSNHSKCNTTPIGIPHPQHKCISCNKHVLPRPLPAPPLPQGVLAALAFQLPANSHALAASYGEGMLEMVPHTYKDQVRTLPAYNTHTAHAYAHVYTHRMCSQLTEANHKVCLLSDCMDRLCQTSLHWIKLTDCTHSHTNVPEHVARTSRSNIKHCPLRGLATASAVNNVIALSTDATCFTE